MPNTNDSFETLDCDDLTTVNGGAETWGETFSNAWQGTKNFAGGAAAGLLHGAEAKTSQVERFAQPNSQATKAGFEMGAGTNMMSGNLGQAVSAGADLLLPAK